MGLAAIPAAVQAAAVAAAKEHRLQSPSTKPPSPSSTSRSRSLLSDSTDADDLCESDTSLPITPPHSTSRTSKKNKHPSPQIHAKPAKKRRPDSPLKKLHKLNSLSHPSESFPAEMLLDLAGSTSAEVRRMNDDERALVHYKRRLRNRESAKRSRARRQATLSDIQLELEDLRDVTAKLLDRCVSFARANDKQSRELETLRKEKQLLESLLREGGSSVL